jgi:two-component system, NtrC family, response regulator GlrR
VLARALQPRLAMTANAQASLIRPVAVERETVTMGRPRAYTYHRFRVAVVAGPNKGSTRDADRPELLIGTAPGNDLVLTDPTVSRHHCVLTIGDEGVLLRDLGSKNGTQLGGFRIESAFVRHGAAISIGSTTVRFESLDEEISEPLSEEDRWGTALGRSPAMRRIFALLPRVAACDSTVLLEGETGTGKTMIAEALHEASPRAGKPFIVVDCGAIPPSLIESELFGHEKGSFTGAVASRAGAFEAANGGTVFLEEIGELPLDMQPKLLRVLEERVVKRLGSQESIRLDVRVIAATNRDLRLEVNKGSFRSDLFYRLHIVRLRIPALRERREDIPLLAAHFYAQLSDGHEREPPADLLMSLARQDWRGNVRELRSAVERAVLMKDPEGWRDHATPAPSPADSVSRKPLEEEFDATASFRSAKERAVKGWERGYVGELIRRNNGNLSRAARAARMDRNHLRELLKRHGVPIRDE